MNELEKEIESRLKSDLWDKKMAKKIKLQLLIKAIQPFLKISIIAMIFTIGLLFWYQNENQKKELFTNLIYDYYNSFDVISYIISEK